ncbi:GGDEF domain-containing protein [Azospirillum agricola]|uniref:GGDEF domain-containing protein n=1 Tax=Azospirillum agricola TaxID=1720247 RepID=UPI000A0EF653|nr:diguanylate cyclase [Azospirillum agricola]SMH59295.1 response regulator receiver modulated diguanylate cyclase [Azospirillum lipoferum]
MRILIVDDSPHHQNMMVYELNKLGYSTSVALNGAEAIEAVARERFDVVMADIRLKDMTGLELCWHLRTAQGLRHLYLILMIPGSMTDQFHELVEAGADEFLRKPLDWKWTAARLLAASRVVAMQRDLERLATTDALTGALNRRRFLERGGEEFLRSRRYERPLSVVMLDIDHFKKVNDTHGHATGDEAIRLTVRCCKVALRDCDLIGRLGGEEFAVVMPETLPVNAFAAAQRVRERIAAAALPLEAGGELRMTVSIGLAWMMPADRDVEQLLARADAALYRAKHGGRNRVEMEPPVPLKSRVG